MYIAFQVFVLLCIFWWGLRKLPKNNLYIALASLLIKIIALYVYVCVHTYTYSRYTPDYQLVFQDACRLADIFWQSPSAFLQILDNSPSNTQEWHLSAQPRAFFAAKIVSLVAIVAHNNFYLMALYGSVIAWWSAWLASQSLIKAFPYVRKVAIISFLFVPSSVFWASACTKETIMMCCLNGLLVIGLTIIGVLREQHIENKYRKISLQVFLFALLWIILWKLKYYYAFGILLAVLVYIFLRLGGQLIWWKKMLAMTAFVVLVLGIGSRLHPNLQLDFLPTILHETHSLIRSASEVGSAAKHWHWEASWASMALHTPEALARGLFSPFWWEVNNNWAALVAAENTVLALLCLVSGYFIISKKRKQIFTDPYLYLSLLIFALLMAVFLAFSSPNFGTLSRYRAGFLPFLYVCVLFPFSLAKSE